MGVSGASPTLQFWVLSRNRPSLLKQTLLSVTPQLSSSVTLIVSDNSDNEEVTLMLAQNFPHVAVRARRPVLSALEHFKAILQESTADFITLFHDDDLLLPGYIDKMTARLMANPGASAVACNGFVLDGETLTARKMMGPASVDSVFKNPEALLKPYMRLAGAGPAPFPAYMYRTSKVRGLFLDPAKGGKYADVSFLAEVARRGDVLTLVEPLMAYRVHANNDNVTEHIGQRLKLMRFILSSTSLTRRSTSVRHFKFRYLLRWYRGLSQSDRQRWRWRVSVVRRFLLTYGLNLVVTQPGLWARVLYRARR